VLFSSEAQAMVDKTLGALPDQTRSMFVMSRRDNKPNSEIASQMGISVKGVEYHIAKALRVLRKNLKDF